MLSKRLRVAVKNSGFRQYHLAQAIGVDHSTLSGWLNGISRVRPGDLRVAQLGALVGVPARACFVASSGRTTLRRDRRPASRHTTPRASRRTRGADRQTSGLTDEPVSTGVLECAARVTRARSRSMEGGGWNPARSPASKGTPPCRTLHEARRRSKSEVESRSVS